MSVLFCMLLLASSFGQPEEEMLTSEVLLQESAKQSEQYEFQAEVASLMDIIINSLYINKEVFLRELISNASDAMDKIRFMKLLNPDIDDSKLEIQIEFDADKKTLSVRDFGVGMTKKDLVEKLGTVAKSGTTQFIEAIASESSNLSLIGQFGVGFYSTFLIADQVMVISKHEDDDQHVWVSKAGPYFSVNQDPRGNTLGRGTQVVLHMKQDAEEYLSETRLKEIVKKYSEFVDYPIYLKVTKDVSKEVPMTEEEIAEAEQKEEEERLAREAEQEHEHDHEHEEHEHDHEHEDHEHDHEHEEPEKKRTKTVTEKTTEWEKANAQRAIWLNDKSENRIVDYVKLYKTVAKDGTDPLYFNHFSGEGEVDFKAIIYVPESAPFDQFENYYKKNSGLRLYVKRVLITEETEDLVPRYMNFLKGVIHSDDMPLNVSRETLQQQRIIKILGGKVVKKVLDMLKNLAEGKDEWESKKEEIPEVEDENALEQEIKHERDMNRRWNSKSSREKYNAFWKEYAKNIKLGIMEDTANRNRLVKLLRFYTSTNTTELSSLDEYVERMPESQEYIYYLAGESKEAVQKSPLIQKLVELNYEVILLDDPIDEYAYSYITDYNDIKFKNVARGELSIGSMTKNEENREKKIKELYQPLTDWWKTLLGKEVDRVFVSRRLVKDPVVISSGEGGYTANMERITKLQAYANSGKFPSHLAARKNLEFNPGHPGIKRMLKLVEDNPESVELKDYGWLLYQTALLNSGFGIGEDASFSDRMYRIIRNRMEISPSEPIVEPEVELDEEEPVPEEDDEYAENLDYEDIPTGVQLEDEYDFENLDEEKEYIKEDL